MPKKNKRPLFGSPLWWQYMRSNSDFLLRIGPLSKHQKKKISNSHYSPPGYGIPPGSTQQEYCFCPKHRYGLFLFPGKIVRWFALFSFLLPLLVFLPFLFATPPFFTNFTAYIIGIFCFWLISYLFYHFLYHRWMPPVLSKAWGKWPTSAYHLFLSVPHKVSIKEAWDDNDEYLYWHPDTQSDMYRQTTEFAPNTQSLQEVILNFAIFECFFQRPEKNNNSVDNGKDNETEKYDKTIYEKNWYRYLLSPIWINYILILFCLIILVSLPIDLKQAQCSIASWHPISRLPYSFIPAILVWFALSLWYTQSILSGLEELHKKVRQGAFNTHLDLVPQQILKELANIPSPEQVDAGIQHIKKLIGFISGIALIIFFAILEVLSQAYGNSPTNFLTL